MIGESYIQGLPRTTMDQPPTTLRKPWQIDPLKHSRVPLHIILTEKESKSVLKYYGIVLENLPGLLVTDPALVSAASNQELEFIPMESVIKIIRNSPLGDAESIYYRRPITS